jgi:hypothetical protein
VPAIVHDVGGRRSALVDVDAQSRTSPNLAELDFMFPAKSQTIFWREKFCLTVEVEGVECGGANERAKK